MNCFKIFVITLALNFFVPQVLPAEPLQPAPRKVIAVVQPDFPPTCFKDPKTGHAEGFAIDLMNEIARRAGIEVEYVFGQTWEEGQEMVLAGKADLIPTLTIDETRLKRFAFSHPVETLPVSMIARNDDQISELRSGMRVGAMRGSISQIYLQQRPHIHFLLYDSLQKLYLDLLAKRLDVIMAPSPSIMKLAVDSRTEDLIRVIEPPILAGIRAMALRTDDRELMKRLNNAIDRFVGTPEYREIYSKWWGTSKPFWTSGKVAWIICISLLISGLVMGVWRHASVLKLNRTLRQTLSQLEQSQESMLQSERTSQRLTMEAERERARSQAILESIQDGISIQGRDYKVLYQNQRFVEMVGEHLGDYCYLAYRQSEEICEGCPVAATFRDAQPHNAVVTWHDPKEQRHMEVLSSPLRDEEGKIVAVIESVRDVTQRKRMEEALELKQQQLEELNSLLEQRICETVAELRHKDQILIQQGRLASMGEMINNIAHQWRQPLNNIGLIVQTLQFSFDSGELTADDMDREIAKAMNVIMYMSRTIDDFRNFFRHDKEMCDFVVNNVVTRSIEFVSATLESSRVRLTITADDLVSAFGYQNEYAQVLLNILANAREVLAEQEIAEPCIHIRVSGQDGRSVVTISDNGGGIPEDILPKIFDPYFTTKAPGKGTGIGLYMSKVIIEQNMGGRLSARNVEGGAEFRIEV